MNSGHYVRSKTNVQRTEWKFVQICGQYKFWKTEMNYYDSLFHGKIKDHIETQVWNLYKCPEDEVVIKVHVCQQSTAVDCGVYTVANAFYILSNVNITSRQLKKNAMWEHLQLCIKVGKFDEFPESESTEIMLYCPEISFKFDVFWTWYGTISKIKIYIWLNVTDVRNGFIENVKISLTFWEEIVWSLVLFWLHLILY